MATWPSNPLRILLANTPIWDMWHESALETVGNTPLVRLNRVADGLPCPLVAKVEFFNPGGSVKDRIGLKMIEAAEEEGTLQSGGTIIESTSGNTGTGVAIAAIVKGYRFIFTTTDKQAKEKADVLRALGAEVIVCPANVEPDDPRSYYATARRLAAELPNAVYLNQYDNPANTEAHYETTGPELWEQTEGRLTHFIAGAGTGGTISGTARYLKEQNPRIQVIGVDPHGSAYYKYFHEGVFDEDEIYPYFTEGVGEDILAGNMNFDIVDDYVRLGDKAAMQMTRRLAREEALFAGQSAGLAVAGAVQWLDAHRADLSEDDLAVVLLPDAGFRYLSKTYNDDWMRAHGLLEEDAPSVTARDVLRLRDRPVPQAAVRPEDTVDEAVRRMTGEGISRLSVIDAGGKVVGSLTEARILRRLAETPGAREDAVREVMDEPFPVVPRSLHLDLLSAYLEGDAEAVLVGADDPATGTYEIITRSDLLDALARSGRNGV